MVLNVWAHVWCLMRLSMSLWRRQSTMEPTWCRKVQKLQEVMQQKVMVELVSQKVMVELVWLMRMSLTPRLPLNMEIQWEISTCRCMLSHHHRQDTRHPQLRSEVLAKVTRHPWWCLMVLARVARQPQWCLMVLARVARKPQWCLMVLARVARQPQSSVILFTKVPKHPQSRLMVCLQVALALPLREAWLAHMRRPRRATKRAKAARAKTWRDCLNGYFWRMGCCLHILIMSRMLNLWTPLRKKKEKSSWVYHLVSQDEPGAVGSDTYMLWNQLRFTNVAPNSLRELVEQLGQWLDAKKALLAFCSCASVIWAQDHNPGCNQFAGPILWKFNDSKCGRLTFFTWCFFVHSLSLHTGLLQSKQYRLAAKQAVQVCCKASSTGLLQSRQYRFAAKQLSLLQSHQTISSRASKGLQLKIGISVWGSVWRMICTMWAITRHISGELTLPLLGSGVQSFVTHSVGTRTYGVCKFDIGCLGSSTAGSLKFWLQPLPWMEQGRSQRMSLRQMNNFCRELFNIQRKRPSDGFCRQSLTILLCPVQKLKV